MWYVYILKSVKDQKYYTGCTNNLERRLHEHNSGYNISTKFRLPVEIIYTEQFTNSKDAYVREKQIKSYKGGNSFKKLLE